MSRKFTVLLIATEERPKSKIGFTTKEKRAAYAMKQKIKREAREKF